MDDGPARNLPCSRPTLVTLNERKSPMLPGSLLLNVPDWLPALGDGRNFPQPEQRMRFVVGLSRRNFEEHSGGPFGAAVFESESGRLLAAGVNCVVPARNSVAHAEILALALAQQEVGCYDLGAPGMPAHEIVCSTEPCLMCLGAVIWSGVRRVVCAARGADAVAVGFDEGPKPDAWIEELRRRGIHVVRDLCREEAVAVLRDYAAGGGPIYNARGGMAGRS